MAAPSFVGRRVRRSRFLFSEECRRGNPRRMCRAVRRLFFSLIAWNRCEDLSSCEARR